MLTRVWAVVLVVLVSWTIRTPPPAHAAVPSQTAGAVQPCSSGLVALTFDDGPARGLTARLVSLLKQNHVPATFFMVGGRVHTAPRAARLVARAGFVIGNHTWSHPHLTRLPDRAVRTELVRTSRELRSVGVRPTRLMRPPYGNVNARVLADVGRLGLVPVLWTVDSTDWRGGTTRHIAATVLRRLRPHGTNIVLQHDGVRNSPASVAAMPLVVRAARRRGYCFARLDAAGRVAVPVPSVGVTIEGGSEAGQVPARVMLRLSEPTSRPVSVRLTARSGTATAGVDFVAPSVRVTFPVGTTQAWVEVPVIDDPAYEPVEDFQVVLDEPDGVTVVHPVHLDTITSDDPAP